MRLGARSLEFRQKRCVPSYLRRACSEGGAAAEHAITMAIKRQATSGTLH
jgi:hypothetical protein